jgi:hypothetical protein
MGGLELLAAVVFFLIGYWIVDYFWPGKRNDRDSAQDRDPPAPTN